MNVLRLKETMLMNKAEFLEKTVFFLTPRNVDWFRDIFGYTRQVIYSTKKIWSTVYQSLLQLIFQMI